ncbi:MAG: Imidazolonepropionase [Chlamydiae bacterium]|nr:Imidazolonepropionase [Chlamydiota bacterium]
MTKLIGPFNQILTMDGLRPQGHLSDRELEIVEDGGIIVDKGHILAIGRYADLDDFAGEREEIDFPSVALPGFVDTHTHICFAGSRAGEYAQKLDGHSYQEIASKGGGILSTVKNTRAASFEELLLGLLNRTKDLLARGVTTCEVKSGYGLNIEDEVKMLSVIQNASSNEPVSLIPTCLAAHTTPPEFSSSSEYLNYLIQNLFPLLKKDQLTNRIDIFVEEGAFSIEEAEKYLLAAKQEGFDLVIHGDQFSVGGSELAARVGALSLDHCEQTEVEQAKLLSEAGVIPIVLPGASIGLGMKFASARMLLDEELPLVIASDWNPGSAPMGDLLTQAAILGAFEKLTMAEILSAITIRAARALNLHDRGILKTGMRADFSVFPTDDYQEILYHQGTLTPQCVFTGGEMAYVI